ncbi:hypothetical protein ABT352_09065 [Streptosporangium sp. NPDC000563]|uniref:hypothetical protein n=1 Tax=unclassified Streptosporangium TaxID=2632669 RepID=UPI003322894D
MPILMYPSVTGRSRDETRRPVTSPSDTVDETTAPPRPSDPRRSRAAFGDGADRRDRRE